MDVHRNEDENWPIVLEEHYDHQVVIVQLFHRSSLALPFQNSELLGTGKLLVSHNQRPRQRFYPADANV